MQINSPIEMCVLSLYFNKHMLFFKHYLHSFQQVQICNQDTQMELYG